MHLTARFEQALVYATVAHAGQTRKGTDIPYVSHLLGVTGIALENGANEDEAIAALLHDAVEDAGGRERLDDIRERFGDAVAEIVSGCSDTDVSPKPPWRQRKQRYIQHVREEATASMLLVSASDKLHNARAILRDCRTGGEAVWDRFNGKKEGTLWYYGTLVEAFRERNVHAALVDELARVVSEIERIAAAQPTGSS